MIQSKCFAFKVKIVQRLPFAFYNQLHRTMHFMCHLSFLKYVACRHKTLSKFHSECQIIKKIYITTVASVLKQTAKYKWKCVRSSSGRFLFFSRWLSFSLSCSFSWTFARCRIPARSLCIEIAHLLIQLDLSHMLSDWNLHASPLNKRLYAIVLKLLSCRCCSPLLLRHYSSVFKSYFLEDEWSYFYACIQHFMLCFMLCFSHYKTYLLCLPLVLSF